MAFEDDEDQSYVVLINDEEQYSLWPKSKTTPDGWREVGVEGSKSVCLEYVDRTWTDMRPLSLRQASAS